MKDSYSFDIDDEGLDASYAAHRDGLHPDLRPARLRLRHRQGDHRRDGRLEVRGVPRQGRRRRGHLRPLHELRLRRQRRGRRRSAPPARRAVRRRPGRARRADARHPDHRHAGRPPQREVPPRRPALGRPATPSRTSSSCSSTPTAPASRSRSACPATARSTRSGSRASSSRSRSSRWTRPSSASTRRWSRATSAPARWGRSRRRRSATSSTPASSRAPAGSPAPTSPAATSSTWSPAATSPPDGTIEAAEVRDGDACPNCDDGTLESARGIEMGHIFQLGRKYAEALDLKVLDENGKLVTVTMGSYGIGVSRAVAAIAEGTHDELGLVWPRAVAPADVHLVATGKDPAIFAAAERIAHELSAAGLDVLYDDRPQGQPRREVQGRRADRRPHHRRGRQGPRRRHDRGQGPPHRRARGGRRPTTLVDHVVRARAAPEADRGDRGRHLRLGRHPHPLARRRLPRRVAGARPGGGERRRTTTHVTRGGCTRPATRSGAAAATTSRARRSRTSSPRPGSTTTRSCSTPTTSSGSRTPTPTPRSGRCSRRCAPTGSRSACSPTRSGRGSGTRASSSATACDHLIDGDVYTSEIPWTKPSPRAFAAAMEAVGVDRPGPLRLRRRPALRRHLGRAQRRPAGDPRPAQHDPGRPGRATPRASRTPWRTRWPRSTALVRAWS